VSCEDKPRILARLLRNGFYRLQKDNKPIYSFKDISDTIVDPDGNVILSTEDISKGLVDKEGKPLRTPFEKMLGFGLKTMGKVVATTKDITKTVIAGGKKAITGVSNFVKRGFGVGGLSGNYGGGSSKDSATMVQVLTQIRDILLTKFRMKNFLPKEDPSSNETEQGEATNESTEPSTGHGGGLGGLFNKVKGKTQGFLGNLMSKKPTEGFVGPPKPGLRNKAKGLLGGLFGKARGLLGNSSSNDTEQSGEGQPPEMVGPPKPTMKDKLKQLGGKAAAKGEELSVKAKNSYQARLAKLDEEAKNRHKFKQTEVKARYGEKGGFSLLGDIFGFVKKIFSVEGISDLLGGALRKIPLLGRALGSIVGVAGKLGGGLLSGAASLATKAIPVAQAIGAMGAKGALTAAVTTGGTLLSGAAAAAGTVASAAGAATMGILGAVGSVLASPVVLTALGIAAVGFVGYKLYKAFTKNDLNDLEKIRYTQYGFNLDDKSHTQHIHRIRALENFLMEKGIVISDGKVSLSNRLSTKEFLEAIELSGETEDGKKEIEVFMGWFVKRFKPFFLKH
jgi:hypothetical protein